MKKDKFLSKLLFCVIPIYFTQGWLFESGGIISQGMILVWLLINVYYVYRYFSYDVHNKYGNALLLFIALMAFYWLLSDKTVHFLHFNYNTYGDLKNASVVCLSYFPFYTLSKNNIITPKYIKLFFVFSLVCAVAAFSLKNSLMIESFGSATTNNTAYYFVVLIPFLGVFGGKKQFFLWFGVCLVFLLLCAKRGALICAVLSFAIYYYLYLFKKGRVGIWQKIEMVLALCLVIYLVVWMYEGSELLQNRLIDTKDKNYSNRDVIYEQIWACYKNGSIFRMAFGYGLSQTAALIESFAHNDWLELILDMGLLGVIFYARIFISSKSLYSQSISKSQNMIKFMYLSAVICWLTRTFFSMGYLAPETCFFTMAMGVAHGNSENTNYYQTQS